MEFSQEDIRPVCEIAGVVGAGLYTGEGDMMVAWTAEAMDFETVGANAVELYRQARRVAAALQIGQPTFIELHTDADMMYCHYCVFPGELGLGALARADANIGLLRYTMKKVVDQVKVKFGEPR